MKKSSLKHGRTILFTLALTALLTCMISAAGLEEKNIEKLDIVSYDGNILSFSYTVESKCPAMSHEATVEITPVIKNREAVAFEISVYDAAYESRCNGPETLITVTGNENIARLLEMSLLGVEEDGYRIAKDHAIYLPPLNSRPSKSGDMLTPPGAGGPMPGGGRPDTPPRSEVQVIPTKVPVNYIEYAPSWKCVLYKRDGARKDGFTGNGNTIEQARNNAASGCMRTNNPYCHDYAQDPAHTTCEVELIESASIKEFDSDKLPANASISEWACLLNKNDGSRNDGFRGVGQTEEQARAQAAGYCNRTNNPLCDTYANDSSHTSCEASYVAYGPKPEAVWSCTLWKRDGARKDGFEGQGKTESEARQNTISGCQRTNNPYCYDYAMDPSHTPCEVQFIYPE
ncbi:MAG TPA: hypothetical protein PLN69_06755 [bacterium]|nr:hypothetical protein [bacterium]